MTGFESNMVTSIDGLRTLYAQPIERIAKKQLDHVNEAGRAFIAASPFLVLATASQQGSRLLAQRRPAGIPRELY
jgi:predicted pyridoxine 5'-phosphate oxidase superfamily flavin-nucleotide-binding protein